MLDSNERGYAIMTKDLDGISLQDRSIEVCKRYCRNDYVIAERIPYKIGYSKYRDITGKRYRDDGKTWPEVLEFVKEKILTKK